MALPQWAAELDGGGAIVCWRCGATLEVATALGLYLGSNRSYFCDPTAQPKKAETHEPIRH